MKLLSPAVGARISEAFLEGTGGVDVQDLVSEQGRDIDVDLVRQILDAAPSGDVAASDGWLAPRLHAALRLSRREASAHGFWMHLAIVDCPGYVRLRFPGSAERFIGGDMIHALSRLWWGAELFRVGADYGPVPRAFAPQDIPNTIFRLKAAHNRVFCAAFLKFIETRRTDGRPLIGRQINRMSTAVNSQLFVLALDTVAPDLGVDAAARRGWAAQRVEGDDILEGRAAGPDDLLGDDFDVRVDEALALLHRFADGAGIATADEPRAGSKRPGDLVDDPEPDR